MKFETYLLRGLFVACLLLCGLVMGAMLRHSPDAVRLAASGSALGSVPAACVLPPDGVICPRG
jgi:hypothetical protein